MTRLLIVATVILGALIFCTNCNKPPNASGDITAVQEQFESQLMGINGVIGVAIGEDKGGRPCILVLVEQKTPALQRQIPKKLEGFPTCIQETGPIDVQPTFSPTTPRDITAVQERFESQLMSIKGVNGVAIGENTEGKPCILVLVEQKTSELERQIPQELEGVPICIEETGSIDIQPQSP